MARVRELLSLVVQFVQRIKSKLAKYLRRWLWLSSDETILETLKKNSDLLCEELNVKRNHVRIGRAQICHDVT